MEPQRPEDSKRIQTPAGYPPADAGLLPPRRVDPLMREGDEGTEIARRVIRVIQETFDRELKRLQQGKESKV
ncbi:hypothetical protein HZA57_08925 [Candidatus Poribacteria bacterium]|nr:hypothetical protein [Candidatus Poribacteria bacterium]